MTKTQHSSFHHEGIADVLDVIETETIARKAGEEPDGPLHQVGRSVN